MQLSLSLVLSLPSRGCPPQPAARQLCHMLRLVRSFQERTTTAREEEETPALGEAARAGEATSIAAGCGSGQCLPVSALSISPYFQVNCTSWISLLLCSISLKAAKRLKYHRTKYLVNIESSPSFLYRKTVTKQVRECLRGDSGQSPDHQPFLSSWCTGVLLAPPGPPRCGTYLADAVDAHVPAGVHFVARSPIDDSVPQLFCEVFVLWTAVQLAGVNWGAEQTETEPEEPGSARLRPPAFCSSAALGSHGQAPPSLHVTISDNTN